MQRKALLCIWKKNKIEVHLQEWASKAVSVICVHLLHTLSMHPSRSFSCAMMQFACSCQCMFVCAFFMHTIIPLLFENSTPCALHLTLFSPGAKFPLTSVGAGFGLFCPLFIELYFSSMECNANKWLDKFCCKLHHHNSSEVSWKMVLPHLFYSTSVTGVTLALH